VFRKILTIKAIFCTYNTQMIRLPNKSMVFYVTYKLKFYTQGTMILVLKRLMTAQHWALN